MTATRAERVKNINEMISQVPTRNLAEIEKKINLYLAMLQAKRMDATVKKNNITLEEIVDEVKKVRHGN